TRSPTRSRSRAKNRGPCGPRLLLQDRERRRIGASLLFFRRHTPQMPEPHLTYLNRPDVEALALTDDEILAAVEGGLRAQGLGERVIEPRVHLRPDDAFRCHFIVQRVYIAPLGLAGVKVLGDYVDNYRRGLPSENGLLTLYDPRTGVTQDVLDAAGLADTC